MPRISVTVVILVAMASAMLIAALTAFLPTHSAGIQGVQDTVSVLRENVMGRVVNGVQLFFTIPAAQVNTLQVAFESGAHITLSDEQIQKMMCGALREEQVVLRSSIYYSPTQIIGCNLQFGIPVGAAVTFPNTTTGVFAYDFDKLDYALPLQKVFDLSWDAPGQWAFFERQFANDNTSNRKRWIDAHAGYDSVGFGATVGLLNSSGYVDKRLVTYLFPGNLVSFMRTLGLTENSRVVAVDANNGVVFANNWGEPTEVLFPNYADMTLLAHERMALKRLSNLSEPTINRVIKEIGGESGFFTLPDNYATTLFDGADKSFVDIKSFRDDYGLNIRVLIVMPERDFTKKIEERQRVTIGAVVGALVAMLLLSVVFAVLLTRPLKRLGGRMYKTASLQDDDADDSLSTMSEIADMQEAYQTMRRELQRMKSFLPQSLINGNAAGGVDDEEDDEGALETPGVLSPSDGALTPGQRSITSQPVDKGDRNSTGSSLRSKKAVGAVAALNMARSIHRRRVAMACVNLVGFHAVSHGGSSTMVDLQSKYLDIVNKHVRDNKGFVDSFHGDHVFASFGAVSLIATPAKRAMLCSGQLAKAIDEVGLMPSCTVGIAAGTAAVGNMGTDSMMRFNVVGSVFVQAMGMERLARQKLKGMEDMSDDDDDSEVGVGGTNAVGQQEARVLQPTPSSLIVATQEVIADGELEIDHQIFDFLSLNGTPKLVAFVGNAKEMATDEWMYQLEQSQKEDAHGLTNQVFRSVVGNDLAGARSTLAKVPGFGPIRRRLAELCDEETTHKARGVPLTLTL